MDQKPGVEDSETLRLQGVAGGVGATWDQSEDWALGGNQAVHSGKRCQEGVAPAEQEGSSSASCRRPWLSAEDPPPENSLDLPEPSRRS